MSAQKQETSNNRWAASIKCPISECFFILVFSSDGLPRLSEGALIIDEVKVATKLLWNSRDNSLVGHSMTMATLQDLYQSLDEDPKCTKCDYVLQTLWRDHSSSHDIIGPYYTSTGPFKAKGMLSNSWVQCIIADTGWCQH